MKRLMDILISSILLVMLIPVFAVISILILVDGKGGIFFGQQRIGLNFKPFVIWKFRTMRPGSESSGQLTIGNSDNRITGIGSKLRKYKLDELPQLWNVLIGEMSLVGPRPEVPRYVGLYNEDQKQVLSVKPGITDYASLQYIDENQLLASAQDPEKCYREEIMPAKLQLNIDYIKRSSVIEDFLIILKTVMKIFGQRQ